MLQRVSIQNFKSLKDVTLDLQKVNLLIGPNNSGKTNFLKALSSVNTLRSTGVDFSVGFRWLFKSLHEGNITIRISDSSIEPIIDEYLLNLSVQPNEKKILITEKTYLISKDLSILPKPTEGNYNSNESILITRKGERFKVDSRDNLRTFLLNYDTVWLASKINGLEIFQPNPSKFNDPADFSADEVTLKGDCSNLTQYLFFLKENHKTLFSKIETDLEKYVGDLISIRTPPLKVGSESKIGLKFFDKNEKDFWADEVSEGVLYFLALLCIIHQPNPPKLLLLEEPERGIHPRRIHEVMNFIFQLAEEKDVQIILTTHNENVLNYFSNSPESVFVFDKNEEGATQVRNLKLDIIEPSHKRSRENGFEPINYTENLGENWMYGILGGVPEETL